VAHAPPAAWASGERSRYLLFYSIKSSSDLTGSTKVVLIFQMKPTNDHDFFTCQHSTKITAKPHSINILTAMLKKACGGQGPLTGCKCPL